MNNQAMAQALRDLAQQQRRQQLTQQPGMQNQNSPDVSTNVLQGLAKYNDTSGGGLNRMLSGLLKGGSSAAPASSAGGTGFGLGQPLVSGGIGNASIAGSSAATGGAASGAGGSMGSALMSNPWTAIAAAIIGGANYLDNKDISSWSDTLKGKAGGNMLDYYGGRDDGKTHGLIGKLHDKDRAPGQMTKAMTDLSELDFGNAFKNAKDGIKSIFKLRF
jgi:hypothetical protein